MRLGVLSHFNGSIECATGYNNLLILNIFHKTYLFVVIKHTLKYNSCNRILVGHHFLK